MDSRDTTKFSQWLAFQLRTAQGLGGQIRTIYYDLNIQDEEEDDDSDDSDVMEVRNVVMTDAFKHPSVVSQLERLDAVLFHSDYDGEQVENDDQGIVVFVVPRTLPTSSLVLPGMTKTTDDRSIITKETRAALGEILSHNLELITLADFKQDVARNLAKRRAICYGETCTFWPCFSSADVLENVSRFHLHEFNGQVYLMIEFLHGQQAFKQLALT
jgi:hypothetical protein